MNSEIPKNLCSVKYPDLESAIRLCQHIGKSSKTIFLSKSDMSSAFRHLPMKVRDFMLLMMKAEHPEMGVTYYFMDKCLPFGSSISCAIFQDFSNAVSHIVMILVKQVNINYLDDYLSVAATRRLQFTGQQIHRSL